MDLNGILESNEAEYERPVAERWGKVCVAAFVGFIAALAAEAIYDHFTIDRRNKEQAPELAVVTEINS